MVSTKVTTDKPEVSGAIDERMQIYNEKEFIFCFCRLDTASQSNL